MTQLETRTEPMVVNFGPHHPSMHGVLRLVVTLDGEDVVDCEPVIGYLHRGMEKIAENRTSVMYVPYVSRMDYAAGMFYEAIVVNAKLRRTGICGAMETLLIDRSYAEPGKLVAALLDRGCAVRGDAAARALDQRIEPAGPDDWDAEYLDATASTSCAGSSGE